MSSTRHTSTSISSADKTAETMFDLSTLQRWFFSAIAQRPADEFETDQSLAEALAERLAPSRSLSSIERLEIYQHAYFARLLDVLREEYSVLCRALGERIFDQFALEYLRMFPSESYTLARLGDRFIEFLEATRPDDATHSESGWADFFIDLARLEQCVNHVFDGPGIEELPPVSAELLSRISPAEFESARLVFAPCVQLLETRFPVNDYFSAILRSERLEIPEAGRAYIAVSRMNFRTNRRSLSQTQYELLSLLQRGIPVGDALAAIVENRGVEIDEFARSIERWFADWTAAGYFVDVRRLA